MGCCTMGSMDTNADPTDHLAIVDACSSFGWLADRRQWNELEALFCAEIFVDYTSLNGGDSARVGRGELVSGWRETLGSLKATQHLIAGHLVTVQADAATCVANFQATHLGSRAGEDATWTLGGHYRFDLERSPEGWAIAGITMTAVWETGTRDVLTAGAVSE
jgi:hypothetical protein